MSVLKEPIGEHELSNLPVIFNRDVIVHIAYIEPQLLLASTYKSSATCMESPIQVNFYEGLRGGARHYKTVLSCCPAPLSRSQAQQLRTRDTLHGEEGTRRTPRLHVPCHVQTIVLRHLLRLAQAQSLCHHLHVI